MILLKTVFLWIVVLEITLCLSPTTIVAVAKIQARKAKAISSAINWKLKNKMAKAKKSKSRYNRDTIEGHLKQENFEHSPNYQQEYIKGNNAEGNSENKPIESLSNKNGEQFNNQNGYQNNYAFEPYEEPYGMEYYPENENTFDPPQYSRSAAPNSMEDVSIFDQYFSHFRDIQDRRHNFELELGDGGKDDGVNINFMVDRQHTSNMNHNPSNIAMARNAEIVETAAIKNDEAKLAKDQESDQKPLADKTTNKDTLKARSHPPFDLYEQPEYQDPSYFDPQKPEDKKELVKFLDKHEKIKFFPKPLLEVIKPKKLDHEKDIYNEDNYQYAPPPLPYAHPIKVITPAKPGHLTKIFKIKQDGLNNLIELLHENGDLLFDIIRPIATHEDSEILHILEHLNKEQHIMQEGTQETNQPYENAPSYGRAAEPIKPPDVYVAISTNDLDNPENPIVGHIIMVPKNYYNQNLNRHARSVSNDEEEYFRKMLKEGTEIFKFLKKLGEDDDKVMVIATFGEDIMKQLKSHLDKNVRKRSVSNKINLLDPSTKIDLSKTMENVGTLAKTIFEHQDTPLYHVRNLVGSAKDTVVATMKIPNQPIITPSSYNIVENPNKDEVLQPETPEVGSRFGEGDSIIPNWPQEMVSSTFQQVGQVIRNSVRSSQDAINHVGEITEHAKKIIQSAQTAPEVFKQTFEQIPIVPSSQPRLASRFGEDETVGKVEQNVPNTFINMGNILDAVGISNPIRPLPQIDNSINNGYVTKTLNDISNTIAAKDIHNFIVQMKKKFNEMKDTNSLKVTEQQCERKKFKRNIEDNHLLGEANDNPILNQDYMLGVSFIPSELMHPFLNLQHLFPQNPSELQHEDHAMGRTADDSTKPLLGNMNMYPLLDLSKVGQFEPHQETLLGATNQGNEQLYWNNMDIRGPSDLYLQDEY